MRMSKLESGSFGEVTGDEFIVIVFSFLFSLALNPDWKKKTTNSSSKTNKNHQYVETLQEQLADLEGAAPAKR